VNVWREIEAPAGGNLTPSKVRVSALGESQDDGKTEDGFLFFPIGGGIAALFKLAFAGRGRRNLIGQQRKANKRPYWRGHLTGNRPLSRGGSRGRQDKPQGARVVKPEKKKKNSTVGSSNIDLQVLFVTW